MARELRRVAPGWEHPCDPKTGRYRPLMPILDAAEAIAELGAEGYYTDFSDFMPPWPPEQATAFQVYEDTTEGTPLSPVLGTWQEVVAWLGEHHGLSESAARGFLFLGHLPTEISWTDGSRTLGFQTAERKWGDRSRVSQVAP